MTPRVSSWEERYTLTDGAEIGSGDHRLQIPLTRPMNTFRSPSDFSVVESCPTVGQLHHTSSMSSVKSSMTPRETLTRNKGIPAPPRDSACAHHSPVCCACTMHSANRCPLLAGMVMQAMASKLTNKFKIFCKTEMMDNFLLACIEYFTFFFEVQKIKVRNSLSFAASWPWAAYGLELLTDSLPAHPPARLPTYHVNSHVARRCPLTRRRHPLSARRMRRPARRAPQAPSGARVWHRRVRVRARPSSRRTSRRGQNSGRWQPFMRASS